MGMHVLRSGRRRIGARLLIACALVGGSVVSLAQPARATASEVLILGSSVSGGMSSAEAAEFPRRDTRRSWLMMPHGSP
jgi:hypothetical protein